LFSFSFKFSVRVNKNCINRITSPIPNSTAEKTSTKKDKDKMFKLSNIKPNITVIKYNVIHSNSAVNSKCSEVFVWTNKVLNKIKNSNNNVLKSPKNKIIMN